MIMQWEHPLLLWSALAVGAITIIYMMRRAHGAAYRFAPTALMIDRGVARSSWLAWLHAGLKMVAIILLACAIGRPRMPVDGSRLPTQGIAIMMLIDVSKSMECFDDLDDHTTRFAAAQREASSFVKRRLDDTIGVVMFGAVAATRCPLTHDHDLLCSIIKDMRIGAIDDSRTVIAEAIAMGVRRLHTAPGKEKIIVLLTDGEPSPDDAQHLPEALALAQKGQVKIYTIGLGNPEGGFLRHPFGGVVRVPNSLQSELLGHIAQMTGGKSFEARNPQELQKIYAEIDRLERSDYEKPQYGAWHELGLWLLAIAGLLICIDVVMVWWHMIL